MSHPGGQPIRVPPTVLNLSQIPVPVPVPVAEPSSSSAPRDARTSHAGVPGQSGVPSAGPYKAPAQSAAQESSLFSSLKNLFVGDDGDSPPGLTPDDLPQPGNVVGGGVPTNAANVAATSNVPSQARSSGSKGTPSTFSGRNPLVPLGNG